MFGDPYQAYIPKPKSMYKPISFSLYRYETAASSGHDIVDSPGEPALPVISLLVDVDSVRRLRDEDVRTD